MKLNKIFAGIIVGIILLAMTPLMLGLIWPRVNDVRTGETPEYPDIQAQRFTAFGYDRVFDSALETAKSMGWEVRESNREEGTIEAVATTKLFKFKDDVTVTVSREGDGAVVNVRSRSRVGKSDLGENARRIRVFQAELARRF